jgi:hypothetical protein
MTLYMVVYQAQPPEYEAMTNKAKELGVKLEFGGGRKTKGGESPNAQIILNLKQCNSKISIARTGRIIIYYPSKLVLKKSIEILKTIYVPFIDKQDLKCQGPVDPLSKAFELKTIENWDGTDMTLSEATINQYEFFDPKTKEYIYVLPDDDGNVIPPKDPDVVFTSCCPISIKTVDKDDAQGKRVITGEKLRWQAMQELRRITKEHRLTPEDLERAKLRTEKQKNSKT